MPALCRRGHGRGSALPKVAYSLGRLAPLPPQMAAAKRESCRQTCGHQRQEALAGG